MSATQRPVSYYFYPIYAEWIFPLLSNGLVHFSFKGCWVVFFIFVHILKENSVNKQCRHWSDAAFCQWAEQVANAYHQTPEPSGIKGCPSKPPSHTPYVQLDPQLPVNSFKLRTWVFLSAFIGHRSFIQGIIQSGEHFYPWFGRRRRRGLHCFHMSHKKGTRLKWVKGFRWLRV